MPRFGAVFVTYKNPGAGAGPEVENIMIKPAAGYKDDEFVIYNLGSCVKLRQNNNIKAEEATRMLNPPYADSEENTKKLKKLVLESARELLTGKGIKKAITDFLKSKELKSSYDRIFGEIVFYKPSGDDFLAKKLPPSIRCMGL